MSGREHSLERELVIEARPETVFSFFTDSARWASWWGAGSTIEPSVGGAMLIRHPNGLEVVGEVVAFEPPRAIAFTYGYASGAPIAPGGSLVRIELAPEPSGTRLRLHHEFDAAAPRDLHVQGWRFQLSLFANLVADRVASTAAETVDAWFAAWAEPEAAARQAAFVRLATADVRFRDRFSRLDGLAEVLPHVEAAQRFMPGMRLARRGELRHCQGTVLADWTATGPDGAERGRGTNVFTLDADGRIATATGLWEGPDH
ncbi:MAG: SRPBCC domain-containing protein [Vicinamibacteria bacterium]|jgi:uncharacterized protein YndB with AHSA1/START domain|nr:SRPBCC domain-containing protein [Vicinamibacteria bacterium]